MPFSPATGGDVQISRTGERRRDLDRLPERARQRFDRLAVEQGELGNTIMALAEQQATAGERKRAARSALEQLRQAAERASSGRRVGSSQPAAWVHGRPGNEAPESASMYQSPPNTAALRVAEDQLAAFTLESERIAARIKELSARKNPVLGTVRTWLRDLPPNVQILDAEPVQIPRGKSAWTVSECRERLAELRDKRNEITQRPRPAAETVAAMENKIEALAAAGVPNLLGAVELGHEIAFPQKVEQIFIDGKVALSNQFASLEFLCFVFKEQITDALRNEILALSDDKRAMTSREKQEAIEDVEAEFLSVERLECALLEIDGETAYRPETSPAAFLNVVEVPG